MSECGACHFDDWRVRAEEPHDEICNMCHPSVESLLSGPPRVVHSAPFLSKKAAKHRSGLEIVNLVRRSLGQEEFPEGTDPLDELRDKLGDDGSGT